MLILISIYQRK